MKKSYVALAAFALAAGLSSCSKSDSNDTLPTNYKIDGIHDLTVQPQVSPSGYMNLNISYVGTVQERVELSLEGVPTGCGGVISVTGGYPAFATSVTLNDTSADPGTYPIKLVCQGSKTGKKSYDFNLVVKPEPDYGAAFLGTYPNSSNSCNYGFTYTTTVTASNKVNKINLNNFDNNGGTIYANITYNGQYISIPAQTINGITYSANTYMNNYGTGFSFSYQRTNASGNYSCTAYLGK